jgi:hypothetical protein
MRDTAPAHTPSPSRVQRECFDCCDRCNPSDVFPTKAVKLIKNTFNQFLMS